MRKAVTGVLDNNSKCNGKIASLLEESCDYPNVDPSIDVRNSLRALIEERTNNTEVHHHHHGRAQDHHHRPDHYFCHGEDSRRGSKHMIQREVNRQMH